MAVKPIPEGYHTVTPYLIVNNASEAIQFYKKALGAIEVLRLPSPDGKVMHAEIKIGDSMVMLADEFPDRDIRGPLSLGGSPVSICLYVEDVDKAFKRAVDAGGEESRPLQDQFYGDRSGTIKDPYGHNWTIATHKEDLTNDEIEKRFAEMMQQHGGD